MLLRRLVTVLLLFNSAQALAEDAPKSPEEFYLAAIEQIGNQAWLSYQRKLLQMLETYAYDTDQEGTRIEYKTRNKDACRFYDSSGVIYSINQAKSETPTENQYALEHWGCGFNRLFEDIRIIGNGKHKMSSFGAFTGVRYFSAPEGQTSLEYTVRSRYNETYFRIYEENLKDRRKFLFWLGDSLLAEFDYDKKNQEILFTGYGVRASWQFTRTGKRWNIELDRPESGMIAYVGDLGSIKFLGSNSGLDRSLNEYRGFANWMAIEPIQVGISDQFVKMDEYFLPRSSFSSSGSSNDELIQEVERMISLLQANDSQTVIAELLKLKSQLESGLIRDLR